MAVETDETAWLPEAPPPRPARREVAIDTALRKFEGIEDAAPATPQEPSWARTHRTQLSVFASAFLLVVIGIPAALIGLRNQPTPPQGPSSALIVHDSACAGSACQAKPAVIPEQPPPANPSIARLPQSVTPPALRKSRGDEVGMVAANQPSMEVQPSAVAAPPPPPAPPPAPASQDAIAERRADQAASQNVVVTGTLIREPGVSAFERRPAQKTGRVASGA